MGKILCGWNFTTKGKKFKLFYFKLGSNKKSPIINADVSNRATNDHAAKHFFRNKQYSYLVKIPLCSMEPKCYLPSSQKPATRPYSEPRQFTPEPRFPLDQF